ncbi:hypothetical protein Y1Q_0013911 [Alligator mississippiensis]|uniref:Uncharacterized protein n=1 Tax=Alligator mississippiensis TaxID=8496 RepID=A0A151MVV5_ALLMI|nr:hypothetical protein Y1Q_0013911 [Alligator mississippiensis]
MTERTVLCPMPPAPLKLTVLEQTPEPALHSTCPVPSSLAAVVVPVSIPNSCRRPHPPSLPTPQSKPACCPRADRTPPLLVLRLPGAWVLSQP